MPARPANTSTCEHCPKGANCDEPAATIETIVITEGYYRFSNTADEVYLCLANCLGSNENGTNDCAEGSRGPLCSLCDRVHYLQASTGHCLSCATDWVVPLLGFLAFVLVCAGIAWMRARMCTSTCARVCARMFKACAC